MMLLLWLLLFLLTLSPPHCDRMDFVRPSDPMSPEYISPFPRIEVLAVPPADGCDDDGHPGANLCDCDSNTFAGIVGTLVSPH